MWASNTSTSCVILLCCTFTHTTSVTTTVLLWSEIVVLVRHLVAMTIIYIYMTFKAVYFKTLNV